MQLYDSQGQRLYLTESERMAFLEAAARASREVRTFALVMAYTGCRISEALALTPQRIDFQQKSIRFETLKKRKSGVYRDVPVPDSVLDTLEWCMACKSVYGASRGYRNPFGIGPEPRPGVGSLR